MKEKSRLIFVDLLRGWALLVMIEVHVFNSMLSPALKHTSWFVVLDFINGLVAPSFLFISGFAFNLSTKDRLDELKNFGPKFWKKISRIGLIFLAGYSLHLPILSLRRLTHFYSYDVLLRFYNVDILQCIAAGLLIMFAVRFLISSEKIYLYVLSIASILVFLLSPFMRSVDFANYMPVPLADYLNGMHGSFFPLFPWLGFLLAGGASAKLYLKFREKENEKKFILWTTAAGLAAALAGQFFLSDIFPEWYRMIRPHPVFSIQRLGYVLFLLGLMWYYAYYRKTERSFVLDIGRESLIVYWLHLQIIYRQFWNDKSFVSIVNGSFGVVECIVVVIALAMLMTLVAKIWGKYKREHRKTATNITVAIVSLCIIIFLIGF